MLRKPIVFDRLHEQFPFLAWPRETVHCARFSFTYPHEDFLDFNLCQIFRTPILDPTEPIYFLLEHLRAIEYSLRYGKRAGGAPARPYEEITYTGGLLYWMERNVLPNPRLAVFKGRGLKYWPKWQGWVDGPGPTNRPGEWFSDVGLIPA
jgi:hypothetical protein